MERRQFLRNAALGGLATFATAKPARVAKSQRKPNIVLLYADDLGWTDLGCYGSKYYETPNLDRFRAQGVKFTSAYSNAANCAPARACLLSGQYVPRHGVYTVGDKKRFDTNARLLKWHERRILAPENVSGLAAEKVTFAEALKKAGYVTGHFGKWHLGGPGRTPVHQGFDVSVPMVSSKTHWITPDGERPQTDAAKPRKYLSDHLAGSATEFIERNREKSFLLYFADYLVHVPLEAKKELVAKYEAKKPVAGHRNPVYAAMIENHDRSCGRILDKLDELGLAENTLVIFFSDNGGCGSAKNRGLSHTGGITSNAPLRGMKGMLYDGGIRVPMVARWPGVTKPGTVCDVPTIGIDLYPTFLDVAGVPRATVAQPLDGESLVPLLTGSASAVERTDIHWGMPGYLPGRQAPAHAMRSGDYKLIEYFEDGKLELFDLAKDIGERTDLSARMPAKVAELRARMEQWRDTIGAAIPERNPHFDSRNAGRW